MYKRLSHAPLLSLIWYGLLTALVLCRVLSSPAWADITISELQFSSEDYFPATPGDEWVYLIDGTATGETVVLDQPVTINGVETWVFVNSDRTREYYSVDNDGIKLHRVFAPKVLIQGLGRVDLTVTFIPPIKVANSVMQVGDTIQSSGTAQTNRLPRVGVVNLPYQATVSVATLDTITVPAGTFDVIRLQGNIDISGYSSDVISFDVAEGVGRVRGLMSILGVATTSELVSYRVGIHDLAVTKITPPKTVTLSARSPIQTKQVKVEIQNRSAHSEMIEDLNMLANLVSLTVESLGSVCPNITAVLLAGPPQKSLPLVLKPKKKFSVVFNVTFDCANDPAKSSPRDPGHEDFRYIAGVTHSALDGKTDIHSADDVCPRGPDPLGVDPNPDGSIKDLGCGNRRPDRTLGADVLTDVILK